MSRKEDSHAIKAAGIKQEKRSSSCSSTESPKESLNRQPIKEEPKVKTEKRGSSEEKDDKAAWMESGKRRVILDLLMRRDTSGVFARQDDRCNDVSYIGIV